MGRKKKKNPLEKCIMHSVLPLLCVFAVGTTGICCSHPYARTKDSAWCSMPLRVHHGLCHSSLVRSRVQCFALFLFWMFGCLVFVVLGLYFFFPLSSCKSLMCVFLQVNK